MSLTNVIGSGRFEGMAGRRTAALIAAIHAHVSRDVVEADEWAGEDDRWTEGDRREFDGLDAADGEDEDILAPARAVVVGLVLGFLLWLIIGAVAYAAYRAIS